MWIFHKVPCTEECEYKNKGSQRVVKNERPKYEALDKSIQRSHEILKM